ncbi:MAG: lysozyme [Dehalococcoidia bacterium]|jgi:lysozyme|nr:lysozyme [Dehalococcoidia bacterium]
MNQFAEHLCITFEGYRAKAYRCPAGVLTIGIGHAILPGEEFTSLSFDEAKAVLARDLSKAAASTFRQCPGLLFESEAVQGAIIDFTFNLGGGRLQSSTLRRRINQKNWPEVRKELNRWVYGGGKKLNGLVLRRAAEAKLI